MRTRRIMLCLIMTFILTLQTGGFLFAAQPASEQVEQSISNAIQYLHTVQNPDGGFPWKEGGSSSQTATSWVLMSLRAAGEDFFSTKWVPAGKSPVTYLQNCETVLESTCDYDRTLLSLTCADQKPEYNGINLVDQIKSFQQQDGQFAQLSLGEEGFINSHMWSILALLSDGEKIPQQQQSLQWLIECQNEDGGFGWYKDVDSDADDTAVAIQAMVLLGEEPAKSTAINDAFAYLKSCQQDEGGFSTGWTGTRSNANTDSWVLQALIAAGEDPEGERWTVKGNDVISHLLSLQSSSGQFLWMSDQSSAPLNTTAFAIMALAGKALPVNIDYQPADTENTVRMFTDLSDTCWAYEPIMKLVDAGILSGYPDRSFRPDSSVSRAEFTKFIVSGLGLESSGTEETKVFPDVSVDYWAHKYISIAVDRGFIKGRTDGSFDPNGKISGAELATILIRVLEPANAANLKAEPYWYSAYVQVATDSGLLYPNFFAEKSASRAECADSIVRLQKLLVHK
ncbi:MAG: S-layer homology domain-containing protein [Bacillota bacterium]|nr:S-layer homology domain-containing protein [Bacillota bacterium]